MNLHIISWSNSMMQTCKIHNWLFQNLLLPFNISPATSLNSSKILSKHQLLGCYDIWQNNIKEKIKDKNNAMHHKKSCLLQRRSLATFCGLTFLKITSSTTACMYLHRIVMVVRNLDPQKYIDSAEKNLIQNMCTYKEMNFHHEH